MVSSVVISGDALYMRPAQLAGSKLILLPRAISITIR
jgi:hypothetical protein